MKKFLRSLQTHFPFLHDLRFQAKFGMHRLTKKPHESDFEGLKHFKPHQGQVFIDIGTNRGESLLSMDIFNKKKVPLVGFEPNPHVYKRAKRYFKYRKHIKIHNLGIGSRTSLLSLNIPFYRKWMFDGLSSFDFNSAHDWLEHRMWNYNEKHLKIRKVDCPVKPLDEFKLNPYFIKIDVQGFELEALKGAYKTLLEKRPILLLESIDENIIDYLHQFGYRCFFFENEQFKPGIGKLNTFCITEDKTKSLKIAA